MKNLTLQFLNPTMEREFQNIKLVNIQKPIYTSLVIGALLYQISASVQTCILIDFDTNGICYIYLTYEHFKVQLWQACIIIMCDFKHSIHLIFFSTGFRLAVPIYCTTRDFRDTFGTIMTGIIFLVLNYLNDKMARTQYLLNKKDVRLQQYMPSIIEKPYFIFEFSEAQRCFTSIEAQLRDFLQFDLSEDHTLRGFLRRALINNLSLEQHIFKYYLSNHAEECTLEVMYNKKKMSVKLYDLNFKNNQYLLIINPPKDHKNIVFQNHMLKYISFMSKHFLVNNISAQISLRVFRIRSQIINNLFLSSILVGQQAIAFINFSKILFKLCKMYRLGYDINILLESNYYYSRQTLASFNLTLTAMFIMALLVQLD